MTTTSGVGGVRPTTAPSQSASGSRFEGDPKLLAIAAGRVQLVEGDRGPTVRTVQQALIDMGFSIFDGPDDAFGARTTRAVKNFQVHASKAFPEVKVTGVVDAATFEAMKALAPDLNQKGQKANVPSNIYDGKPVRVLVLKDEHRTFVFDSEGKVEAIYGNAVGAKATSTDEGLKVVAGTLGERDSIALGKKMWGGPVFGPRIVNLNWADGRSSGEELHGTSNPKDLGLDVSHGCVRHENVDIVRLAARLSDGDTVAIVKGADDPHLGEKPQPPPEKKRGWS